MPRRIEVLPLVDFTGGLNLDANAFQLQDGESPDMLNVDLDPRGGFGQRNVVEPFNLLPVQSVPLSIWPYSTSTGTKQVLIARSLSAGTDCEIMSSTGGNFTAVTTPAGHTSPTRHRAITFNDLNYIVNGVNPSMRYNGTVLTELTDPYAGATWDADLASPGTGEMPIGKCIAVHFGSIFIANILDTAGSDTARPNRIHWSHPGAAEAWRSQDYIDVDLGHDGDQITALVPFNERLYIFKNRSIYVLSGFSPATFSVSQITNKIGAPSQEAVKVTEQGIFFYSWPRGPFFYSRSGFSWIGDRIHPAIVDGTVNGQQLDEICVGSVRDRIWFSVPTEGASTGNLVYVFDPSVRSGAGSWTKYDLHLGPMLEWGPPGADVEWLACLSDAQYVVKLEKEGDQDEWGTEYLLLDGTGDIATTPDVAAHDIVGDIDLRASVALDDWTPASSNEILYKWGAAGQRSYGIRIASSGAIVLEWTENGTATFQATSSVTLPAAISTLANGDRLSVRATLDVDDGAGEHDVNFYYSLDTDLDTATWTQLGVTQYAGSGTTSIFNSTSVVTIGGANGTASFIGKVYAVQTRTGIAGTKVIDTSFASAKPAVDATYVWTYAGNATFAGGNTMHDINSYYQTKWVDAGATVQYKRWKRPEFVFERAVDSVLTVKAYHDYDPATQVRGFTITPDAGDSSETVWGDNWGTLTWASHNESIGVQIEKGSTLGRARSVLLEVHGPTPSTRWTVNAITHKFIPQRVRS